MKNGMAISIVVLVAAVMFAAGFVFFGAERKLVHDTPDAPIPPVQSAENQATALRLAREVDVPSLQSADRVVLEVLTPTEPHPREELRKADSIAAIRRELKPSERPPSGGMTAYRVTFSRGEAPIRTVWVYGDGEWGFERTGTSWTTGASPRLAEILREHAGRISAAK